MSKGYDSACYDLAIHFLYDDYRESLHAEKACIDELAQQIQNAVEGFLSTHECKAKPVFDGGRHYLPDVRSDIPRPVCVCSSSDLDRTPCAVHGKAV